MTVQTATSPQPASSQPTKGLGAFAVRLDTAAPFRDLYLNRQAIAWIIVPNDPQKSAERARKLVDGAFKAISTIIARKRAEADSEALQKEEGKIRAAKALICNSPDDEVYTLMRGYSSVVPQSWVNQARFRATIARERLDVTRQNGVNLIKDIHDPRLQTIRNCGPCRIKLFDYFKASTLGLGFDPDSPMSLPDQLQLKLSQARKDNAPETEIARLEEMIGLASLEPTERTIHVDSSGVITTDGPGVSQGPQKRLAFTLQIDLDYLKPSYLRGLLRELGQVRNQLYLPLPPDHPDPGPSGVVSREYLSGYIPVSILPAFAHLISVRMEPSTDKKVVFLGTAFEVGEQRYISIEGMVRDFEKEPPRTTPNRSKKMKEVVKR